MAPRTSNLYGKIVINKRAIKHVVVITAQECYGVASVGKAWHTSKYDVIINKRADLTKAVTVTSEYNHIVISIMLYLKFGVTVDPVIESIRRAIKYNVETFTGMTVECVNIDILGIMN